MSKLKFDCLIAGAGFAGLSTAYHLAKASKLKIAVVDRERRLGVHASGNNAGMVRQSVADPVNAAFAVEGRRLMAVSAFKGVIFKPNGSLLLADDSSAITELQRTQLILKSLRVPSQILDADKTTQRVPLLRKGRFKQALFCPTDGLVNPQMLLEAFRRETLRLGVQIFAASGINRIERSPEGFAISADGKRFDAERLVNAAGAWTLSVAEQAGAQALPFKAYRRHLFESTRSKAYHSHWPFVWDLSEEFYFRPGRPNRLILSPCDKTLFMLRGRELGVGQEKKARKLMLTKLKRFGGEFGPLQLVEATSGLRTMVPDGRFVIGEDPKVKGFYWAAGLGGHGLTASFSVGKFAAMVILNKHVDRKIKEAVSAKRFA